MVNRAERRKAEKMNKQVNTAYQEQQLLQRGLQRYQQGKAAEAKAIYQEVLRLNPHNVEAYGNLGVVMMALGNRGEALSAFQQAVALRPSNYEAAYHALKLLYQLKRNSEAEAYSKKLLAAYRGQDMLCTIAIIVGERGNWSEAIAYYKEALTILPNDVNLWNNIGNAYKELKEVNEAEKAYQRAIELNAEHAVTYYNRAGLYLAEQRYDKVEENYLQAIALDPQFSLALLNLSLLYVGQGRMDKAMEYGKRAFATQPDNALAHSSYLFMMHYDPMVSAQQIAQESRIWAERHTETIPRLSHSNDPNPERRLRVGYVSADLRKHAVATYIEPVLRSHDKSQVEIFCYSNSMIIDDITRRLQSYADHWREIHGLPDDLVAEMMQQDSIDILIDLSGHTGGQRLQVFARKPAPIQATWIGYFNTTGMKAMDYIITDRFLVPPEEEALYVEKPLRLPHSAAVYLVPDKPITVKPLPGLTNGYVTLGCFNALPKLTPEVIELWVDILKELPDAKLYLKNKSFDDIDICKDYRKRFKDLGIDENRLIFAGFSPIDEYFEAYNQIDIGLDPFPYNGGTTTLDSLWMGVPTIALRGDRLIGHVGESLLAAVNLEEFIAANKDEYVAKAVALAKDLPKLAKIRANLRQTLIATPNTNPALFTRGLETAFRDIWREWCSKQ